MCGDTFSLPKSALATVAGKKKSDRYLMLIADVNCGSLKSLHILFDKYLDHVLVKFEEVVWSELCKIWSFLTENSLLVFEKRVDTIFEDFHLTEAIV